MIIKNYINVFALSHMVMCRKVETIEARRGSDTEQMKRANLSRDDCMAKVIRDDHMQSTFGSRDELWNCSQTEVMNRWL